MYKRNQIEINIKNLKSPLQAIVRAYPLISVFHIVPQKVQLELFSVEFFPFPYSVVGLTPAEF